MPLASIAWLIYLQITRSVRVVLLSIAMTVFEFSEVTSLLRSRVEFAIPNIREYIESMFTEYPVNVE